MPRGFATGTKAPVRFHQGRLLAWVATGERERGLPVYRLRVPKVGDRVLHFPMGGNARGCVQVMNNPSD